MRKTKLLSLLLIAISFIAINCTKEGPEGPVGATGPQGPAGVAGPTGGTGATGTANVIYSAWFSFVTADWGDTTLTAASGTAPAKRAIRTTASVTQNIIDQGVVIAYYRNTATDGANVLPFTFVGPTSYVLSDIPAVGKVIYTVVNTTGGASNIVNTGAQFRYVIIPGGVSGGRMASGPAMGYTLAQLRELTYDQVITKFGIPSDGSNE